MEKEYKDIKFILKKENLYLSYPLIKENYEYIKKLKAKGYQFYLLTNITEDSYQYIYEKINISEFLIVWKVLWKTRYTKISRY